LPSCIELHTANRLVPLATLMPIGHLRLFCVYVIRFLSIGFAIGFGVPFGVSTSAMNWSLKFVQTNSGYSAEKKYELKENALAFVGARRRMTSITESFASGVSEAGHPGEFGRPFALLSGGFAVENQSCAEYGWPSSLKLTWLDGCCFVETLKPP